MTNALYNLIDGSDAPSLSGQHLTHAGHMTTGPSVVTFPRSDLMDVVRAVQAMNQAQATLSKATRDEREAATRTMLQVFVDKVQANASLLGETLQTDIGMSLSKSAEHSLPTAITFLRNLSAFFETQVAPESHRAPATGNAAVFLGWTDPLISFCRRVPVVLAAGCSVVVKPSSNAPRTVALLSRLLKESILEAKLPAGFFALLHGSSNSEDDVGHALLTHPGIKTIYWVGRSETALKAQEVALRSEKRFHFVGSGRNPAILFQGFEPAQLNQILEDLADAITDPHGIGPYRPSRLFVQESIYKDVIESLAQKLAARESAVGSLITSVAERFDTQVRLALSETGKLVTGGHRHDRFAQPTLVRDLTNCSTLQGEELAGPWATIASFKYQHEALKYANVSPLGLAAYVLHPDREKARGVAEKLETSRVFFSSRPDWATVFSADAPPLKQSANGTDGLQAIFEFSRPKSSWFFD